MPVFAHTNQLFINTPRPPRKALPGLLSVGIQGTHGAEALGMAVPMPVIYIYPGLYSPLASLHPQPPYPAP